MSRPKRLKFCILEIEFGLIKLGIGLSLDGISVLYLTTYRPRVVNVAKELPLYLNELINLIFFQAS